MRVEACTLLLGAEYLHLQHVEVVLFGRAECRHGFEHLVVALQVFYHQVGGGDILLKQQRTEIELIDPFGEGVHFRLPAAAGDFAFGFGSLGLRFYQSAVPYRLLYLYRSAVKRIGHCREVHSELGEEVVERRREFGDFGEIGRHGRERDFGQPVAAGIRDVELFELVNQSLLCYHGIVVPCQELALFERHAMLAVADCSPYDEQYQACDAFHVFSYVFTGRRRVSG